jgi:DNA gyrase/topoisomerase IV subunit A
MTSRGQPLPQLFPALASKEDRGVMEITSAIPRSLSSSTSSSTPAEESKEPAETSESNIENEVVNESAGEEVTVEDTKSAEQDDQKEYIVLLSRKGVIKKLRLSEFDGMKGRGIIAMMMKENDSLAWARLCDARAEIIIATR